MTSDKLIVICRFCDDGNGACIYPYYGEHPDYRKIAEHWGEIEKDKLVRDGDHPINFRPDFSSGGTGTHGDFTHCPSCGAPGDLPDCTVPELDQAMDFGINPGMTGTVGDMYFECFANPSFSASWPFVPEKELSKDQFSELYESRRQDRTTEEVPPYSFFKPDKAYPFPTHNLTVTGTTGIEVGQDFVFGDGMAAIDPAQVFRVVAVLSDTELTVAKKEGIPYDKALIISGVSFEEHLSIVGFGAASKHLETLMREEVPAFYKGGKRKPKPWEKGKYGK